jgi:ankyrin repeat protein
MVFNKDIWGVVSEFLEIYDIMNIRNCNKNIWNMLDCSYQERVYSKWNWEEMLEDAVKRSDYTMMTILSKIIYRPNDLGMQLAARYGNEQILKWFIDRGGKFFGFAVMEAAANGHSDIIEHLLNINSKYVEQAITAASANKYFDLSLKLYKKYKPRTSEYLYMHMCSAGDYNLIKALIDDGNMVCNDGADDIQSVTFQAIDNGHFDVAQCILDNFKDEIFTNTRDINKAAIIDYLQTKRNQRQFHLFSECIMYNALEQKMLRAAKENDIDMMLYCMKYEEDDEDEDIYSNYNDIGKKTYDEALEILAGNGNHHAIQRLSIFWTGNSLKNVDAAALNGHLDTVIYLIEHGKYNIYSIICSAVKGQNMHIIEYMLDHYTVNKVMSNTNTNTKDVTDIVSYVVASNNISIIDAFAQRSSVYSEQIVTECANQGKIQLIKYMIDTYGESIEYCVLKNLYANAAAYGQLRTFLYLLDQTITYKDVVWAYDVCYAHIFEGDYKQSCTSVITRDYIGDIMNDSHLTTSHHT